MVIKTKFLPLSSALLYGILLLNACNLPLESPTPIPMPTTTAALSISPTQVQHQTRPGTLPAVDALSFGDQDTSPYALRKIAPDGDRFLREVFERPFNANTMDTYYPYLDIQQVAIYQDDEWFYGVIFMNGVDASQVFPASYGFELDLDINGRGDWLILASNPQAGEWSTTGVKGWQDSNKDVGNNLILGSDPPQTGDGYDFLVFDQGQGSDPDAAWSRLVQPNMIQLAFKKSLIEDSSFMVAAWAGMENLNPAWFDLHDHFTHDEAGAADPGFPLFYPIKALDRIDNTCRMPVGFGASGGEPGLCPTYIPKEAPGKTPGAPPPPPPPPIIDPGPF